MHSKREISSKVRRIFFTLFIILFSLLIFKEVKAQLGTFANLCCVPTTGIIGVTTFCYDASSSYCQSGYVVESAPCGSISVCQSGAVSCSSLGGRCYYYNPTDTFRSDGPQCPTQYHIFEGDASCTGLYGTVTCCSTAYTPPGPVTNSPDSGNPQNPNSPTYNNPDAPLPTGVDRPDTDPSPTNTTPQGSVDPVSPSSNKTPTSTTSTTGLCCIPASGTGECFQIQGSSYDCLVHGTNYVRGSCSSNNCDNYILAPIETTAPPLFSLVNPLKYKSLEDILYAILKNVQSIIVVLAIVFIVLAGVIYILAGGNEKRIGIAKAMASGAVIGFAIALAAPTFLKEILAVLGGEPETAGDMIGGALTVKDIIVNVLRFTLSAIGTLAIISFVIAGAMYLTAGGDERKIDTAKRMSTYAIIGIIVAFSALVILNQIAKLIGASQ